MCKFSKEAAPRQRRPAQTMIAELCPSVYRATCQRSDCGADAEHLIAPSARRRALDDRAESVITPCARQTRRGTGSAERTRTADVYLNSRGGSLAAGIALGRLLRRYNMATYIGSKTQGEETSGGCFSACVYAFIGGSFRYMAEGDTLGIHIDLALTLQASTTLSARNSCQENSPDTSQIWAWT